MGSVAREPRGQDQSLQNRGRDCGPLELLDGAVERVHVCPCGPRLADALPCPEEAAEDVGRDGFDLTPQRRERASSQASEHLRVDPLTSACPRAELALQDAALTREPTERPLGHRHPDAEPRCDLRRDEGAVGPGEPRHEVGEWVSDGFEERCRHADGEGRAEGIAESRRVLDPQPNRTVSRLEGRHPRVDRGRFRRPGLRLVLGQVTEVTKRVVQRIHAPDPAPAREPLELELEVRQALGIDQLPELLPPQQLGQEGAIERQRLRPPFGEGRVALVHERRDVAELQRAGEGRGHGRVDFDDPNLPPGHRRHELDQAGHVEDLLQAFAVGLEDHRERAVARGDLQEVRAPLPLLPERGARSRPTARQEQRPRGTFAEAGRE